jgi:uncharacterized ferredoxin-like protein
LAGEDFEPIAQKMNEMAQKYNDTLRDVLRLSECVRRRSDVTIQRTHIGATLRALLGPALGR